MSIKTVKIPGPDHPITIAPAEGRVVVRLGDTVVAETDRALTLREASYRPVQYIPLEDVDPAVLAASEHTSYCPFKGDATYYSVVTPDATEADVIWTYEDPYDAVDEIKGHVAFYADRVQITGP